MAGEIRPFGEVFAEGTRNGLARPKAVRGAGVKMVNMGELFAHPRLRNADMDRVPLSDSEARKFLLSEGDLLFARQSLVLEGAGKCSIFLSDDEPVTFESHVTRVRLDRSKADPRFYFYYLQSHHGKSAIRSIVEQGAGASGIRGSDLQNLGVLWMPPPEQRAIARILGTLDDKIELNRRRNQTLEAMARALFKDWFVDFGPVRAKMEAQQPYLPADLWQLFPDRLDDEGKPEGWKYLPYGEMLEGTIGGDWGKEEPCNDHDQAVCIIRGTDIPDLLAGSTGRVPTRYTTKKKLTSRILQAGDIVVEVSGGSPTQPTGRSLQVSQLVLKRLPHPVVCASFCRRFRPKSIGFGLLAAHHLTNLYRDGGTWEYQNQSTGISNFQTAHFLEAENVLVPSEGVLKAFVRFVEPILAKTTNNETIALVKLRDTLLPKLISGELRIPDAEKFMERAEHRTASQTRSVS